MMTPEYNLADIMPQTKLQIVAETASTIVAGGAVTAHMWLPSLKEVSEIAAELLPMFGIVLITLQIVVYMRRIRRGRGRP